MKSKDLKWVTTWECPECGHTLRRVTKWKHHEVRQAECAECGARDVVFQAIDGPERVSDKERQQYLHGGVRP